MFWGSLSGEAALCLLIATPSRPASDLGPQVSPRHTACANQGNLLFLLLCNIPMVCSSPATTMKAPELWWPHQIVAITSPSWVDPLSLFPSIFHKVMKSWILKWGFLNWLNVFSECGFCFIHSIMDCYFCKLKWSELLEKWLHACTSQLCQIAIEVSKFWVSISVNVYHRLLSVCWSKSVCRPTLSSTNELLSIKSHYFLGLPFTLFHFKHQM